MEHVLYPSVCICSVPGADEHLDVEETIQCVECENCFELLVTSLSLDFFGGFSRFCVRRGMLVPVTGARQKHLARGTENYKLSRFCSISVELHQYHENKGNTKKKQQQNCNRATVSGGKTI